MLSLILVVVDGGICDNAGLGRASVGWRVIPDPSLQEAAG